MPTTIKTSQANRAATIAALTTRKLTLNAELATFTMNSKAQRAIALRTELAELQQRIDAHLAKQAEAEAKTEEPVTPVTPIEQTTTDESLLQAALQRLADARDNVINLLGGTSLTRKLCSWMVSLVTTTAVAYGLSLAIDYLVVLAMSLTSGAFLALLVYVIGMVISIYATFKLFNASYHYIADRTIDHHVDTVRGWLGFGPYARKTGNLVASAAHA